MLWRFHVRQSYGWVRSVLLSSGRAVAHKLQQKWRWRLKKLQWFREAITFSRKRTDFWKYVTGHTWTSPGGRCRPDAGYWTWYHRERSAPAPAQTIPAFSTCWACVAPPQCQEVQVWQRRLFHPICISVFEFAFPSFSIMAESLENTPLHLLWEDWCSQYLLAPEAGDLGRASTAI